VAREAESGEVRIEKFTAPFDDAHHWLVTITNTELAAVSALDSLPKGDVLPSLVLWDLGGIARALELIEEDYAAQD
jgi:hypothetical protein